MPIVLPYVLTAVSN